LCGVAVLPSVDAGTVALRFLAGGVWLPETAFSRGVQQRDDPMDRRLREIVPQPAGSARGRCGNGRSTSRCWPAGITPRGATGSGLPSGFGRDPLPAGGPRDQLVAAGQQAPLF